MNGTLDASRLKTQSIYLLGFDSNDVIVWWVAAMADIVFSGWPDPVLGDRGLPDTLEAEPASLDPSRETVTFKTQTSLNSLHSQLLPSAYNFCHKQNSTLS